MCLNACAYVPALCLMNVLVRAPKRTIWWLKLTDSALLPAMFLIFMYFFLCFLSQTTTKPSCFFDIQPEMKNHRFVVK